MIPFSINLKNFSQSKSSGPSVARVRVSIIKPQNELHTIERWLWSIKFNKFARHLQRLSMVRWWFLFSVSSMLKAMALSSSWTNILRSKIIINKIKYNKFEFVHYHYEHNFTFRCQALGLILGVVVKKDKKKSRR